MLRDSSSNTPRLFQVLFLHTVGVMMVSPNFFVISRSNLLLKLFINIEMQVEDSLTCSSGVEGIESL